MKSPENLSLSEELALRKGAHIELAPSAQTDSSVLDRRFYYEPLFFSHSKPTQTWPTKFLQHELDFPLWLSSMTGGTEHALTINQNLAKLCGKYKLGMGLGSCRALLSSQERLQDFSMRSFLGDQPFFANLGIAQVANIKADEIHAMVERLEATGLIIHINPLQEWMQPEGDRFEEAPLTTLIRFLETTTYPVMVKEVGQGMGPRSLTALMELPIAGVEFGAFGGTNFTLLESLRTLDVEHKKPFIQVGHTALEMVESLNQLNTFNKEFIISGGIKTVLDGLELKSKLKSPSVVGMAHTWLKPAMESFETLENHFFNMREAYLTAKNILEVK